MPFFSPVHISCVKLLLFGPSRSSFVFSIPPDSTTHTPNVPSLPPSPSPPLHPFFSPMTPSPFFPHQLACLCVNFPTVVPPTRFKRSRPWTSQLYYCLLTSHVFFPLSRYALPCLVFHLNARPPVFLPCLVPSFPRFVIGPGTYTVACRLVLHFLFSPGLRTVLFPSFFPPSFHSTCPNPSSGFLFHAETVLHPLPRISHSITSLTFPLLIYPRIRFAPSYFFPSLSFPYLSLGS